VSGSHAIIVFTVPNGMANWQYSDEDPTMAMNGSVECKEV